MQAFFSCFSCGQKAATVSDPKPISITSCPVDNLTDQNDNNNLSLIQSFDDAKSKSNTTITFRTADTVQSKKQDDQEHIRAKIQQVRKKDLAQKKVLQQQFVKQNLIKSKIIYLVEKQWSEEYTRYLRDPRIKELRAIDNRSLLDQKGKLRGDIKQKTDYFIVNERIWKFVTALYGGGPDIARDIYFPVFQLNARRLQLVPCGMVNPLNLCYLISVMQTLLSIPYFNFYFFKKQYLNEQQDNNRKKPFHTLLCKFVRQYYQDTATTKKSQQIKEFASYFESKFSPQGQHDAQQFFLHISNLLQQEMKIEFAQPKSFNNPQTAYYFYMHYNQSIIDKIFAGQISSVVNCKVCKQDSVTFLPFIDLCIQINDTTLQGCLKRHFSIESKFICDNFLELEDLYECQKCKKKSKASKKFSITKTPNYLMIVLKKFTHNGKKIWDKIKYPLQLDVKKISEGNCGQTRFSLMSVIIHNGQKSNKGHYYCYTKRNKKDWCYFNDDKAQIVDVVDCLEHDAYMLLYERQK